MIQTIYPVPRRGRRVGDPVLSAAVIARKAVRAVLGTDATHRSDR